MEGGLNNSSVYRNINDKGGIFDLIEQAQSRIDKFDTRLNENKARILVKQFMNLQVGDCLILFPKIEQEFFTENEKQQKLHTLEEGALTLFTPVKVFACFEMLCHFKKIYQQTSSLQNFIRDRTIGSENFVKGVLIFFMFCCFISIIPSFFVPYPSEIPKKDKKAFFWKFLAATVLSVTFLPTLMIMTFVGLWNKLHNKLPLGFFINQADGASELEKLLTLLKDSFLFDYDPAFLRLQNNIASLKDLEDIIDKALKLTDKPQDVFVKDWVENTYSNENHAAATMRFFHTGYCQNKSSNDVVISIPEASQSSSSANERTPLLNK